MNRNVIIAVISLLALLGIGAFVIAAKKGNNVPAGEQTMSNPTAQATTTASSETSLKELFSSGASQKCTFNVANSKESSGIVYVANGKVRGDFTVKVSDKDITTHMIGDGTTSYIWTDGQSTGFKMAFDPTTAAETSDVKQTQSQSMDVNAKMNYNCSSWNADQALFVVPTTVKFAEMNVPKTGTTVKGGTTSDMKIQQCAACDNAPDTYKAQCKASLGCN